MAHALQVVKATAAPVIAGCPQPEYGEYYVGYVVPFKMPQAFMAGFTMDITGVTGARVVLSEDGTAFDLREDRASADGAATSPFRMAGVLRGGLDHVRVLSWQQFVVPATSAVQTLIVTGSALLDQYAGSPALTPAPTLTLALTLPTSPNPNPNPNPTTKWPPALTLGNKHSGPAVIGDCLTLTEDQGLHSYFDDVEKFVAIGWLQVP